MEPTCRCHRRRPAYPSQPDDLGPITLPVRTVDTGDDTCNMLTLRGLLLLGRFF